ncbi:hypothetical protein [Streptomyces mirabilis]|uniref:hypothetical protein n=1 Tax=Streptomyces mirabilis TaxID=68239 RepID=UPI0036B4F05F
MRRSPIPYSVVRATPFFESVDDMSRSATYGESVHVAPVLMRPVSTDDDAALAHVAVGVPLFGVLDGAELATGSEATSPWSTGSPP